MGRCVGKSNVDGQRIRGGGLTRPARSKSSSKSFWQEVPDRTSALIGGARPRGGR
jgi:hypothetical protein